MTKQQRMEPVVCRGTCYEMGHAYGTACADRLRTALDTFFDVFKLLPEPPAPEQVCPAAMKLLPRAQKVFPGRVEFVRGQAEGAGEDFEKVFALHCFLEVFFGYNILAPMCTSFAVTGPATADGRTILGQNVDWFVRSPIDILRQEFQDGSSCFAVCLAGVPYYYLTSDGLGISLNLTLGLPFDGMTQVPITMYVAEAMSRSTVEEAAAVFEEHARGLAYGHIADAKGSMVGVESAASGCTRLLPERGVLAHANHYETPAYRKDDWTDQILPCTKIRGARIRELMLARHGELTPEIMMEIMRDHHNHPESICRHAVPGVPPEFASDSRASIIMIPEDRAMWVSFGPPCENEYFEYRLD